MHSQKKATPKATASSAPTPAMAAALATASASAGAGASASPQTSSKSLRALLKDDPSAQAAVSSSSPMPAASSPAPIPTAAASSSSKSIASLLGKRKDPPDGAVAVPPPPTKAQTTGGLGVPVPGIPMPTTTLAAAASSKRVTRKNVTITPSYAPRGHPIVPELRQFKYPTWTSNTDQLRNTDCQFLSHPAQEMLKYRMVVDSPPCTPWQFTREMQRKQQEQWQMAHHAQLQASAAAASGELPQGQGQGRLPKEGPITVIVHPGSRYIRAGFETDVVPRVIMPNCLARRVNSSKPPQPPRGTWRAEDADLVDLPAHAKQGYDDALNFMEVFMNAHIKEDNIRVPYNARGLITSFNGQSRPTSIPAVNDPFHIEWTSIRHPPASPSDPSVLVGQQALDMDLPTRQHFNLRYPLRAKSINTRDYSSWSTWHADMAAILDHVLASDDLGVRGYADRARTRMVLVVPDLVDMRVVDELMRVVLDTLKIGAVLVALESPMSCLGAGLMSATVVDIGAQATSVAVVENGEVVDAARVLVGGDDVSDVLFAMMRKYKNPITRDVPEDARDLDDYARGVPVNRRALVESIKEQFVTGVVRDAAVIRASDVYVREPGKVTERFTVKMYDELYMAPLCLFYPWCLNLSAKLVDLKRYSPLLVERTHPSHQMPLWTLDPPNKLGPHPFISWGCTDIPDALEGHTGLEHRVALTAQLMWLDELNRNARSTKRRANGELAEVNALDEETKAGEKAADKRGKRKKQLKLERRPATALGFPGISPPTGKVDSEGDVEMRDAAETEDEESEEDEQPQLRRSKRGATPAIGVTQVHSSIGTNKRGPAPANAGTDESTLPVAEHAPADPSSAKLLGNLPAHCATLYSYAHTWVSPPLDQAIHALIAGQRTDDRIRRNYSSILLVGGGARMPGFATKVLEPILRSTMPPRAKNLAPAPGTLPETAVAVTLPPRDLDPRAVMWKGGTVLARLEVASEMWVSLGEWRALGTATVLANKCGVVLPGSGVVSNLSGPTASLAMDPVQ